MSLLQSTDVRCRTCGWESYQPDELKKLDGLHHAKTEPKHEVLLSEVTVQRLAAPRT